MTCIGACLNERAVWICCHDLYRCVFEGTGTLGLCHDLYRCVFEGTGSLGLCHDLYRCVFEGMGTLDLLPRPV